VTHDGFLRDQAEHAQRKLNEQELERWKEEAKEQWKVFNNSQKAEIMSWCKEKVCLAALKQKAPPKPPEVQMRERMAKNYLQPQQNKSFTSLEASRDAGQSVEAGNMCPA
jgi:DNA topoisomerase IB